ncbi:hypothetical protein CRG98_045121 [Punica granatum]|uniref:Uncharacterized protein n=1 Tax=Punica granatum TaxID=22663 RepID=A0A2I0HRZ3_PUNGR|nr:hypothetical protein CRG98_045121 [Punica granatum]
MGRRKRPKIHGLNQWTVYRERKLGRRRKKLGLGGSDPGLGGRELGLRGRELDCRPSWNILQFCGPMIRRNGLDC